MVIFKMSKKILILEGFQGILNLFVARILRKSSFLRRALSNGTDEDCLFWSMTDIRISMFRSNFPFKIDFGNIIRSLRF